MRYLFVHQNFPGQFLHLLRHLTLQPGNDIVFITEPNDNNLAGVRKLTYQPPVINEQTFLDARDFEMATGRARIVQELATRLKGLGFQPDIVIGHHGWGELLNIRDVWDDMPLLGYYEFYYREKGVDVGFDPEFPVLTTGFAGVRAKNAVNLLALDNPGHGQTPTQFQLSTYPAWAQDRITVLPEGVDLALCRPDPSVRETALDINGFIIEPGDTLVTYIARDLEPYRGFHVMMRALPGLHRLRPNLKVVMVGGDGVSYGARLVDSTWRAYLLSEVGAEIDPARVTFPGRVPYELFLKLLQRSDAHVYLTYPFVLSWSLREALACGCAIVGSDTPPVRELVTNGKTGLLTPFTDPAGVVACVARLLDEPALARRLRRNARAHAEKTLRMDKYLEAYEALIEQVIAQAGAAPPSIRQVSSP
ncbi:MAG: glycosyltransferase [Janthinobacterium lividum]